MEFYVGLDVSLKQTSICVVDQTGLIAREGVVDSDPEAISVFLKSKAPDAVRIGLETGPTSTWLWTELKRLGLPVVCIDARHAKAVLKMQINKSDRNDAIGIARIMQTGWFKEVHVKDIDSHSVRALLASRALLVKIKRDSRTRCAAFSRTSVRATAIATLNRQRHLTPSCGGIAPTAERTVGPARMIVGELDTQTRN
jgi:transposase